MRIKSWNSVVPPLAFLGSLRYFDDYQNIKFQALFHKKGHPVVMAVPLDSKGEAPQKIRD
jgi:hypothetical protein